MDDGATRRRRPRTGAADIEADTSGQRLPSSDDNEFIPVWVIYLSIALGILILVGTILYGASVQISDPGYHILFNGTIHTSDERMPNAGVVVVKGGRFVDVAPKEQLEALTFRHPNAKKIDLGGLTVLPGLTDSHMHIHHQGSMFLQVQLMGADSLAEVRSRVAKYLEDPPQAFDRNKHWLMGMGWDQTVIKDLEGEFPTKDHLDSDPLLRSLPIMLYRVDFHAGWLNGKALDAVSALYPDNLKVNGTSVDGGEIVRLSDGRASGILVDTAMKFAEAAKPKFGVAWDLEAIDAAVESMLKIGVTGAHDAAMSRHLLSVFKQAIDEDRMPLRVYGMLHCDDNANRYCGDDVGMLDSYGGDRLTVRSVKLFMDGAVGSWGAYLWEPYADKPNVTGLLRADASSLNDLVWEWVRNGWQVNSHAIGDRASTLVVDAYERAIAKWSEEKGNVSNLRLRIEHAQFIRPEDIQRIGKLGIIPSMQPTHCTSDMWYVEKRLGKKRARDQGYRWKSLLNAGVKILALGSDAPVENVNPFAGLYSAITRQDSLGRSPHGPVGWNEHEVLTRKEALDGFTISAAYASFQESKLGSITPNKLADYIIIDRDVMAVEAKEILGTEVLATVIGGRVRYSKEGFEGGFPNVETK